MGATSSTTEHADSPAPRSGRSSARSIKPKPTEGESIEQGAVNERRRVTNGPMNNVWNPVHGGCEAGDNDHADLFWCLHGVRKQGVVGSACVRHAPSPPIASG